MRIWKVCLAALSAAAVAAAQGCATARKDPGAQQEQGDAAAQPPGGSADAAGATASAGTAPAPGAAPAAQGPRVEQVPGPDRGQLPERGPPPELETPAQRHFALSNGLKVRLVEYRRLPIVALHLVVGAGAVHDPPAEPGLASFTAAMLTEGTKTRTATRISDELGFLGASLGAGAGHDSASLSGSSLVRHLPKLLEVFADVLVNPTFPAGDFNRLQDERIVALVQQRDVPGAVASKAFAKLFWGAHPYGHWVMGTEESVKAMDREDLAGFHRRFWRPNVSELVVVGDVSEAELKPLLEKALVAWKPGPVPKLSPRPKPPARKQTVLISKREAPQAYLMMGMPAMERSSPDFYAAEVAFQVLGGGMSSRLFRNLREKEGYTYGIYARAEARKLGGTSFIVGSVQADSTGLAVKALLSEIASLRDTPVTDGELEDAKNALVLSLPGEFATAGAIAGKLAEEVVYGLPDEYWDQYADRIRAVTADEVMRVAQRVLDPAKMTVVMVCEPDKVKPQLAGLPVGPIEVRAAPAAEKPQQAPKPARKRPAVGAASPGMDPAAATAR